MEIIIALLVGAGVMVGLEDFKPADKTEPVFVYMMQDRPCDFTRSDTRIAEAKFPLIVGSSNVLIFS